MKFFLVSFSVTITEYMGERGEAKSKLRIVIAGDADDARAKLERYYRVREESYGTSYYVDIHEVSEAIQ